MPRRSGPPIAPRKPMLSGESGVNLADAPKKTQLGVAQMDGQTTIAMDSSDLRKAHDSVSGERPRPDVSPYTQRLPSAEEQSGEKPIPGTAPLAAPMLARPDTPSPGTIPLAKPFADMMAKKVSEAPKPIAAGTAVMPPLPKAGTSAIPPRVNPSVPPPLPLVDQYATNQQLAIAATAPVLQPPPNAKQPSVMPPPAAPLPIPAPKMNASAPPPAYVSQPPPAYVSAPPPAQYASAPPPMMKQSAPPPAMFKPSAPPIAPMAIPSAPPPPMQQRMPSAAPAVDPSEGDRPTFHMYSPADIQSRQKLPTLTGEMPIEIPKHKMSGLKLVGVLAAVCLVIGTIAAGIAVATEEKNDKPAAPTTATAAPPAATAPPVTTVVSPPVAPTVLVSPPLTPGGHKPQPKPTPGKPTNPSTNPGTKPTNVPLPGNPYGK